MNPHEEIKLLEKALRLISGKAREFNLDFYDMFFEICPAEIIYTFGAYSMPTRFSHWTFGKAYHKMKTQYDYNLGRIYEMVINSNPCYAFLLEGNTLIQNKLVMAHVLGHCDFFKNNAYFKKTSRVMVESMAAAADRFRGYEFKYGHARVESFIDAAIAIQEHIEPRDLKKDVKTGGAGKEKTCRAGGPKTPYDDLWSLDQAAECHCEGCDKKKVFPENPEKDLVMFIIQHSKELEDWQRDIMSVIRQEMQYFWPQMETKIMNEGWASYWHLKIMREIELDESEAVEFAKMHSGIIQTSRSRLNPYALGLKIFEDIEKRWDDPTAEEKEKYGRPGGQGREKIFEVRAVDNDISFLRNYLTRELVEEMDLYLYKKVGYDWKIVDKEWEKVRDATVNSLTNCSYPYIVVQDGDFNKRGELYLKHNYEGAELDVLYLEKTLPHVYTLWGRPAHLETVLDEKPVLFSYNGEKCSKKFL
ncbi:SpoVR family protein [Pelotomaculum propionicicum]|uniref:SpoVR family protein n=1 Tax=Pelotomaculum propionicicum TaxID=258475 RepID=UPI003B7F6CAE